MLCKLHTVQRTGDTSCCHTVRWQLLPFAMSCETMPWYAETAYACSPLLLYPMTGTAPDSDAESKSVETTVAGDHEEAAGRVLLTKRTLIKTSQAEQVGLTQQLQQRLTQQQQHHACLRAGC